MLTLFICAMVFIFPLFLNIHAAIIGKNKKFYVGIYLFGIIKILSGYAEKISDGFAFHLSNKKALIFNRKSLLTARKSIKPFMDYHSIKIKTVAELGSVDNEIAPFAAVFAASFINSFLVWFFALKKPYLKIENEFNVYRNENVFNAFCTSVFVFNFLMILISIIKIFSEKIIYAFKQRRKNKNKFCD